MPTIASASSTAASNIIMSIRDQIPDPVSDPTLDGQAFKLSSLLRWLNDAGRIMAMAAPVITDWGGIQSQSGMDTYVVPSIITSIEQIWFDLLPLTRSPELDDIFTTKITGRSWWFGPHSMHATPRIHIWPACNRTGSVTTIDGAITADDTSLILADTDGFKAFGMLRVEDELILYRSIDSDTGVVTNILRGQGGTTAASHNDGAAVTECNIFFKCWRLPTPLTGATDTVEVPQGLWPLLELYVIAKVREAEQEYGEAAKLRQEFTASVEKLGEKAQIKGLRQGIQVRSSLPGPKLYGGRIYVP